MEIGKKLKNARIEAGLTQEKAAEKIDVSRQTISNWENEKSYPDIISVIALSDLYSVSLDELLKGDQKMAEHLFCQLLFTVFSNAHFIRLSTLSSILLFHFTQFPFG